MRLSFFLLFIVCSVLAKGQVVVSDPDTIVNLAYTAQYIEDPHGELTIHDLIQQNESRPFKQVGKQVIGFGLTPSFFWIKSIVRNETDQRLYIKISNNSLTDIHIFETNHLQLEKQYHTGNWQPFDKRPVRGIGYLFPLEVKKDSSAVVYIRVMHLRGTQFPLHVGTLRAFYVIDNTRVFSDGIYYGLMLLMILYNLFIYFSLKDTSYLFYVTYVFLIALLNASLDGYAFQYMWPSLPQLNPYEDIIAALVGVAGILFVTHFLNTKANAPLFHKIYMGLFIAYVVAIVIIVTKNFLIGSNIMEAVTLASVVCTFVAAYVIMKKGFKPAKFFLIAWTLLLVCIVVFIVKDYNLVPYNDITVNALQIGSGAEALLLSIALADRINIFRKEKARAQHELIQSLQEKTSMQQEMLELEAKALRSQMNPHFIFNCMNSIKALIQQKDEDKAVNYLTTFSKLLRTILQNLDKREISLFDEIETCRLYTQLESMRFGNKFSYSFLLDADVDTKSIQVPALILQPFIENSIWHGLMPKEGEGYIKVGIEKKDHFIFCIVDDNGIGRESSMKNKFKYQGSTHQSKGVTLTQSRLDLHNALNKRNVTVKTIDKKDNNGNAAGTTVVLSFQEY
jgi:sensor histidine kinase YesM